MRMFVQTISMPYQKTKIDEIKQMKGQPCGSLLMQAKNLPY